MKVFRRFLIFTALVGVFGSSPLAASDEAAAQANAAQDTKPSDSTDTDETEGEDDAKPTAADDSDSPSDKNGDADEDTSKEGDSDTADKDDAQAADEKPNNGSDAADKPAAATKKKKKRKTHTVESERFRVDVKLDGRFVADKMTPVSLRPEEWTRFKISKIVEHGSTVQMGDVLVEFDDAKIKDAIDALDLDLHINELGIQRAEQELPRIEQSLEMTLEDADRQHERAEEKYKRHKKLEKEFYKKLVQYTVKQQEYMLKYERDELEQLEKMYTADDLTEETEEIVLSRQRDAVDMALFQVEDAEFYRDGVLDITLPQMESNIEDAVERTGMALARARMAHALEGNRARYELEKMKLMRARSLERHAKLLGDRALMKLKAPADGIVYFGKCVDGNWVDSASLISKLQPESNATVNSILMTIVETRPMYLIATAKEQQRPFIESGQAAKVMPPPTDSDALHAEVTSVGIAPYSTGKFQVKLALTNDDSEDDPMPDWLVPGMSAKITINTYEQENAIVIPKDALHTDEDDDEIQFVWVVDPDDEKADAEKRTVKVGRRSEKEIEILAGLQAGEVVSLEDEDKK